MLESVYRLDFEIELLTGLHIGGSTDTFDIGGADSTVIKNPLTHEPYIPGSSIKGKLRSLLTQKYGKVSLKNKDPEMVLEKDEIRCLFEPVSTSDDLKVSRCIFRDAYLTDESKEELQKHLGLGTFTEIKAENSIDLLKGTAANPRFIERVPRGAKFNGEIILQIYEGDDAEQLKEVVKEALKMLELNYLGGSGTRGYGRVEIHSQDFQKVEF
ncbi:type III-A CRISPR-associated RAMP protein Csm3 [Holdemanella porci]|uniref:type III-A CRISPR-associated RAMP protein Csm3 n=1 Tax=Holdemanella porci TaxID=2652276 RepID=UPI003F8F084C